MTFVGKVLVVVNVVMTVCVAAFAGGVYAFQTNWRTKYQEQVKRSALENQANQEEEAKMKAEIAAEKKKSALAAAEAGNEKIRANAAETTVAGLREQLKRITVQRDTGTQTIKLLTDDNTTKLKLLEQNRKFIDDLHVKNDSLTDRIAKLEDAKYGLEQERKQMVRRYNALLVREIKYKTVLAQNDIDYDLSRVAVGEVPPKPAEGRVVRTLVNTRSRTTLVLISVGKDDGVAEDQVLTVYRLDKGKFVGKIKIVSVTADEAVGQVIVSAKNGKVEVGDNVSAKL